MNDFWLDLRFAARMFSKTPGFTAVVVATLAVGIGATTAVFSIMNTSLLKPLAYPESEEVLLFFETHPTFGYMSIAYPNYLDWRESVTALEEIAVYRRDRFTVADDGGPEQVGATMVSANLFRTLGVGPLHGRAFTESDDRVDAEPVAALSYGYWQRRFGGDPGVIGRTLTMNDRVYEVVGVMPRELRHPSRSDVFVPIGQFADTPGWSDRGNHPGITGLARLADGATLHDAHAEIDVIAAALAEQYPDTNTGTSVEFRVYEEYLVSDLRPALYTLGGAVLLVMLIACTNIANLLLARATTRERELALRGAMGAGRGRIAQQLLTESVVLALLGGAFGIGVAHLVIEATGALFSGQLPRVDDITVNAGMLAFAGGVAFATGLLFGILPALHGMRGPIVSRLHAGARGSEGREKRRTQSGLVVAQVGLAVMLLVGAGLLARSFVTVLEVDPGFDPDGVVTADIQLQVARFPQPEQALRFWETLLPRVHALPGVVDAGLTTNLPLVGGSQTSFEIAGRPALAPVDQPFAEFSHVTPSYFDALGMRLLRGRLLGDGDRVGAPGAVVIDAAFAAQHWPDADPLGASIIVNDESAIVVGIVDTVRHTGLDEAPPYPQMYFALAQNPQPEMTLVVRSTLPPETLAGSVRAAVLAIDPNQPVSNLQSYDEIIDGSLADRRLSMTLLGWFAAAAVALALIGVYGVVAYGVTRRFGEFGVRIALGANGRTIRALVLREGVALGAAGMLLGVGGALAIGRYLESQLFGVSAYDPLTFALVPPTVLAFALFACWLPARRASEVDPMHVLRRE